MNITRFEPWNLFDMIQRDFACLTGHQLSYAGRDGNSKVASDRVPAVDIVEEKDRFMLRADVPGVKREDIEVHMENGVLTIAGQRSKSQNEEHEGMRRVERIGGPFYRRFSLPDTANADDISATSRDGILEVSIPKRTAVLPRKITVEAA
jgi:HSP20 family protein